jgi:hypothetical protein
MLTGDDNVLHRAHVGMLSAGIYWHVFPAAYEPTAANPASQARLAWRYGAHSMFYAGDTPAAALWETVLRYAAVRHGDVYTVPAHLQGMVLARLLLSCDVPVVDLRTPFRREVGRSQLCAGHNVGRVAEAPGSRSDPQRGGPVDASA